MAEPERSKERRLRPLDSDEQDLLRKIIGVKCKKAREELGLSQRSLAQIMRRSASWVREIEHGAQYAPPYLIQSLSRATQHSVSWFYGVSFDPQIYSERVIEETRRQLKEHS